MKVRLAMLAWKWGFATAAEPVHNEQPLAPQTDDGNEPILRRAVV